MKTVRQGTQENRLSQETRDMEKCMEKEGGSRTQWERRNSWRLRALVQQYHVCVMPWI